MQTLIGVDPGSRDTGIIAIAPDGKVTGYTVHNDGDLLPLSREYVLAVGEVLDEIIDTADGDHILRVESVTRPNWHVGKGQGGGAASNPEALLGTAQMLGAIMAWYPCELVAPRKNGSDPLGSYPPELVSKRERLRPGWQLLVGQGVLRHQRSAWDIAHGGRASLRPSVVAA